MLRIVLGSVGGFLLLFTSVASADEYSKRTVVTINEPVIVAGVEQVTLQPGKYVIKLLNHDHNRNIVLFYNERENKLFATVMAINNYRLFPTDKTVLKYWETPGANPPALRAWFPPGDHWGQEFVYPKVVALRIATETGAKVLTAPARTEEELVTAPVTEIEATGKEVSLEEAFVAPPEEELANAEPGPAAPEPLPPEPLPPTASPIFAIGLLGLVLGSAGTVLRRLW
jgi:hypothetical protein